MIDNQVRVFSYSAEDDKVFVYQFTEREVQETAAAFSMEIFFFLTDEELQIYLEGAPPELRHKLKKDYIWFSPGVGKRHIMQCTCGQFLESGHSMDKLAKLGLKHHKRTGHTINLRGN